MQIRNIAAQFPPFAQEWVEKRLHRHFNLYAQLPSDDEIIGVKDYLASLTEEDKIHQKLNKVSWRDAVQLQKNWHEAIARKSEKMTEFEGDDIGETFINCGDGYRWIELNTPEQFDFEGNAMGHCIGQGGYDETTNRIFSLRDKNNLPHVTIEFDPEENKYKQIQGRANKPVIADYWGDTVKLFNILGEKNGPEKFAHGREYVRSDSKICFEQEDIEELIKDETAFIVSAKIKNTSFGITTEGKFLYLNEEPPEGTAFKMVVLKKDSKIRDWKWNVTDDFDAAGSLLKAVSADVKFGGNVNIESTRIKHWKHDVPGNFSATCSSLKTISNKVKFGGDVSIERTGIKHWKHDVPGNFFAYCSLLETVSDNVKFGGNVNIRGTNVKHWHNDVLGNFKANGTQLETVSDNVKFGGNVNISETNVRYWQNDVTGNFNANETPLKVVAENVRFGGDVDIGNTKIKHWHNDVAGNFSAYGSWLKTSPPMLN